MTNYPIVGMANQQIRERRTCKESQTKADEVQIQFLTFWMDGCVAALQLATGSDAELCTCWLFWSRCGDWSAHFLSQLTLWFSIAGFLHCLLMKVMAPLGVLVTRWVKMLCLLLEVIGSNPWVGRMTPVLGPCARPSLPICSRDHLVVLQNACSFG